MVKKSGGKTIVITGGSSGIGAAAARRLAEKGAQVVITGRSEKTKRIAEEIGADPFLVDYTSFADVARFAKSLTEKYARIDVLVNNAGAVFPERRLTEDGNEMTWQVNHLSGFLLTRLLQPKLEVSRAVVINTSSAAHAVGRLDFSDLQHQRRYSPWLTYGTTKLMNILHAMEINRRFDGVHAVSFHPGSVATDFTREMRGVIRWIYTSSLRHFFLIPPERGADTLVWLVQGTPGRDWIPGGYYVKPGVMRPTRRAGAETAAKLWTVSEELVAPWLDR